MKIHIVELPLGVPGRHEVVLLADHGQALAKVLAERDTAISQMQNIRKERDAINKELGNTEFNLCIAQQQLVEAAGLLGEVMQKDGEGWGTLDGRIESFLARHAQAGQQEAQHISIQEAWEAAGGNSEIKAGRSRLLFALRTRCNSCMEAQGAQAGDEAEPAVSFAAWLIDHREGQPVTEEDMHAWLAEWYETRAALTTQPAAGEPEQQTAINADDLPTKKYPLGAFDFDATVAAGEPLLWQVRHCDNDHGWGDWEEVVPRSPALGQTVEHRLQEYRELIGRGYRYELRALGIVAPPAAAHGDEAVRAFKTAFHGVPEGTGYDDAVRAGLAAAMRAQAGEGGEV